MDKKLLKLLLLAMSVGVVFVVLIFGESLGLIASFLVLLILSTLIIASNDLGKFKIKRGGLLLISLILLGLSFTYHSNGLFQFINVLLIIILGTTYTIYMVDSSKFILSIHWITKILKQIFYPIGEFDVPVLLLTKGIKTKKISELPNKTKGILIGLMISVPILTIMVILLSSADQVFKSFVSIDVAFLDRFFEFLNMPKIIVFLFVTLYIFSYFYFILYKSNVDYKTRDGHITVIEEKEVNTELKEIVIQTLLIVINILFLFFTFIQFKYLFTSSIETISSVITYSSYARKGFFELTLISLLNIGLIVFLTSHSFKKMAKFLMTLLVFNTLIIAYSALFRMHLYVLAYGYTWLRVMSAGFIILQGLILVMVLYHVWKRNFDIKLLILLIYLVTYVSVNYVNVDSMIIKGNVNRYLDGSSLDTEYFYDLSYASVKTLKYYEDYFTDKPEHMKAKTKIIKVLSSKKHQLSYLDNKWYNFNLSEYKAKKLLK